MDIWLTPSASFPQAHTARTPTTNVQSPKPSFFSAFKLSQPSTKSRTIPFNSIDKKTPFPPNVVRNQKYNVATFFPLVLYEQFKFFFNLYFLLVALSQFVPALRIGTCSLALSPVLPLLTLSPSPP